MDNLLSIAENAAAAVTSNHRETMRVRMMRVIAMAVAGAAIMMKAVVMATGAAIVMKAVVIATEAKAVKMVAVITVVAERTAPTKAMARAEAALEMMLRLAVEATKSAAIARSAPVS